MNLYTLQRVAKTDLIEDTNNVQCPLSFIWSYMINCRGIRKYSHVIPL